MTVIRPNSISGVTSITAQGDTLTLYKSDGTNIGQLDVNIYASSGVSTIANLDATNINASGIGTFGRVAIGTDTPVSGKRLTVDGDNATGVRVDGNTQGGAIEFSTAGTITAAVGNQGNILGNSASGLILYTGTGNDTRFYTGGTETLRVTSSGDVGIGTAAPRSALDLAEKTDAIALPQGTTAQRPSGNNPYLRWNTTNSALEFYNGTDWVEIISDYFPSGSTILG